MASFDSIMGNRYSGNPDTGKTMNLHGGLMRKEWSTTRPLWRGAMMLNRFLLLTFAVFWTNGAIANGEPRSIDISGCLSKNCMARDVHTFYPEKDIKVQAWFDVVNFPDKPDPLFYPLFNVFNYSENEAEITIGMQLLDQKGEVLLEATGKATFKPTQNTESSYETYLSINARPISSETAMQTKFVRVVYKR